MPTAEKRRQKRETKRAERRAIKLHVLSVGHSMPLPQPPDFGPAKFSPEEQAANPGKPMTRLIKDVLRQGSWKEGFDEFGRPVFGEYTPDELGIIFNNALAMMKAGDPINLGKSHGDEQLIIPTDELISPVDDIRLHNDVIWVSTYVTPDQAAYLQNPACKVSAGLFPDYTAGNGAVYKGRTMLHVAVTDRPVVGGQGPFIALSNYVALGTWSESKHPRKGGKFASGGGASKPSAKGNPSYKSGGLATSHKGQVAELKADKGDHGEFLRQHGSDAKAVSEYHAGYFDGQGQYANKKAKPKKRTKFGAARRWRKKEGKSTTTDKVLSAVGLTTQLEEIYSAIALGTWSEAKHKRSKGQFAAGAASGGVAGALAVAGAKGRQAVVDIAKAGFKKAKPIIKKVATRAGKAGVKAIRSAGRTVLKVAKSQGVRKGLKAGAKRAMVTGGRIIKTIAKSPLRKAVLRFENRVMVHSAIALANSLQGGMSMDPTILAAINALLAKLGVEAIPDGTPPEQIGPILTGIAMGLGVAPDEAVDEAEDAVDGGAGTASDVATALQGAGAAPAPMAMANLLKAVDQRIAAGIAEANKPVLEALSGLQTSMKGNVESAADLKKAKFIQFRNALGKAGVAEAVLAQKDKIAAKLDWDTDVLEGLHPTIKMSNLVSAGGATEEKPEDTATNGVLTDEQVAARVKAKGGKIDNMPLASRV